MTAANDSRATDPSSGPSSPLRAPSVARLGLVARRLARADDGAATAEYAIVILAAVGFAGLLVTIMRSDEVRGVLSDLIRTALSVG